MQSAVTAYQRVQTEGLNQRDLIVTCYKGAIKYLEDAKKKHEQEDFEAFCEIVEKAHRVLLHLYTTLDMERGGLIAEKLGDLYAFLISQIYIVSATKNTETVDNIIKILTTLKEGWEGLSMAAVNGDAPAQQSVDVSTGLKAVSVEI